jgi:hypothetical protein
MTDLFFQELNKGHWNIVILLALAVAIFMGLKRYVTMNEVRHKEHTHLEKILSDNLVELKTITKVHENDITGIKDDIKDVRIELRQKKTR